MPSVLMCVSHLIKNFNYSNNCDTLVAHILMFNAVWCETIKFFLLAITWTIK